MQKIQFNIPYTLAQSAINVQRLIDEPHLLIERYFSILCIQWLEEKHKGYKAYLTPSATQAMALLASSLELELGDEIIMASFNYVGVATSFANCGAKIVFVDIDPNTMCLEVDLVEQAITNKTKAIVATNYNGVGYKLKQLQSICKKHGILLIEDNAQGVNCESDGQLLGTFGDVSCISFDPLKNISAGEGGVLLCKENLKDKIDICYENGTNKQDFLDGKVNAYQWIDKGSRYFMSEYNAAILYPLLKKSESILKERRQKWSTMIDLISKQESINYMTKHYANYPDHNSHIAYIKLKNKNERSSIIKLLAENGIQSSFHYVPLHSSPAGQIYGRNSGALNHTDRESDCLLRLPMHNYLTNSEIDRIIKALLKTI